MTPDEVLELRPEDRRAVVAAMESLAAAGRGWVNLTPTGVEPPPTPSVWGGISGRGPSVPRITWTAPQPNRRRPRPAQLGIEHPAGGTALDRLAEEGHALPNGWTRVQDHAMRGLVVVPPSGATADTVLDWALGAVEVLTGLAADGGWQARVFRSS